MKFQTVLAILAGMLIFALSDGNDLAVIRTESEIRQVMQTISE